MTTAMPPSSSATATCVVPAVPPTPGDAARRRRRSRARSDAARRGRVRIVAARAAAHSALRSAPRACGVVARVAGPRQRVGERVPEGLGQQVQLVGRPRRQPVEAGVAEDAEQLVADVVLRGRDERAAVARPAAPRRPAAGSRRGRPRVRMPPAARDARARWRRRPAPSCTARAPSRRDAPQRRGERRGVEAPRRARRRRPARGGSPSTSRRAAAAGWVRMSARRSTIVSDEEPVDQDARARRARSPARHARPAAAARPRSWAAQSPATAPGTPHASAPNSLRRSTTSGQS